MNVSYSIQRKQCETIPENTQKNKNKKLINYFWHFKERFSMFGKIIVEEWKQKILIPPQKVDLNLGKTKYNE
ncbi:MAG: hypothetical protein GF353_26920 [Candidatus Lokiarchaeota archaeon]|nr:hypothetical protein [Candidatus Lokiarchaeota archaeon]